MTSTSIWFSIARAKSKQHVCFIPRRHPYWKTQQAPRSRRLYMDRKTRKQGGHAAVLPTAPDVSARHNHWKYEGQEVALKRRAIFSAWKGVLMVSAYPFSNFSHAFGAADTAAARLLARPVLLFPACTNLHLSSPASPPLHAARKGRKSYRRRHGALSTPRTSACLTRCA